MPEPVGPVTNTIPFGLDNIPFINTTSSSSNPKFSSDNAIALWLRTLITNISPCWLGMAEVLAWYSFSLSIILNLPSCGEFWIFSFNLANNLILSLIWKYIFVDILATSLKTPSILNLIIAWSSFGKICTSETSDNTAALKISPLAKETSFWSTIANDFFKSEKSVFGTLDNINVSVIISLGFDTRPYLWKACSKLALEHINIFKVYPFSFKFSNVFLTFSFSSSTTATANSLPLIWKGTIWLSLAVFSSINAMAETSILTFRKSI